MLLALQIELMSEYCNLCVTKPETLGNWKLLGISFAFACRPGTLP